MADRIARENWVPAGIQFAKYSATDADKDNRRGCTDPPGDRGGQSTVERMKAAASSTLPAAVIHERSERGERKKTSAGKVVCDSVIWVNRISHSRQNALSSVNLPMRWRRVTKDVHRRWRAGPHVQLVDGRLPRRKCPVHRRQVADEQATIIIPSPASIKPAPYGAQVSSTLKPNVKSDEPLRVKAAYQSMGPVAQKRPAKAAQVKPARSAPTAAAPPANNRP